MYITVASVGNVDQDRQTISKTILSHILIGMLKHRQRGTKVGVI